MHVHMQGRGTHHPIDVGGPVAPLRAPRTKKMSPSESRNDRSERERERGKTAEGTYGKTAEGTYGKTAEGTYIRHQESQERQRAVCDLPRYIRRWHGIISRRGAAPVPAEKLHKQALEGK